CPSGLRARVEAARSQGFPLTPAFYQELLKLEQRLPIEPYAEMFSTPAPPAAATAAAAAEESAETAEAEEAPSTNTGPQFTNKAYFYSLLAFCVAFGGGYLYFPVSFAQQQQQQQQFMFIQFVANSPAPGQFVCRESAARNKDRGACRSVIVFFAYFLSLILAFKFDYFAIENFTMLVSEAWPARRLQLQQLEIQILLLVLGISGYQVQQKRDRLPLILETPSALRGEEPLLD
ncbi:hypothetical protein, conserved, partial [Eimeria tenella]